MDALIVESEISSKILTLRGQQVMLDRDLAVLYQVETKRLNEQVKRNLDRFPDDFMFQLTEKELKDWKSQFATSNKEIMGLRKLPYAFTEEGIYMLATVLRSPIATQTTIHIIRTFKKLREFSKHYNALAKQLLEIDRKHEKHYKELKIQLDELVATSEVADIAKIGFIK
ncbi:MAG: hypothetical protein P794_01800 [Epsilonproteobacteria bacterium (ex Lamellibrachia satsuma)]|nr:MAG: hypothetical protein P794_01800 [Epsilonproteobacteria bacterium (ex Lamellibrachia satsuma)]